MTNLFDPTRLFTPFMPWADIGLRAADITVSSSQDLTEGVDRFTRATASDDVPPWSAFSAVPASIQRSMFDLMTQGWVQWMSSLGSIMSLAAGLSLAQTRQLEQAASDAAAGARDWPAVAAAPRARSARHHARTRVAPPR